MASPLTPGSKPEKIMSSRLMTMKFMQRAAASNHTPVKRDKTSQEDTTPDISQPQPKRMRFTGKDGGKLDASTPRSSELQAISAAVAEEQRKRSEALRRASGIGQTEWVLKFSGDARILKASKAVEVVNIGGDGPPLYLVSGSEQDDSRLENETGGRMSFGNYRRRKQREHKLPTSESGDSNEEDGELEEPERMIDRARRKAEQRAETLVKMDRTKIQSISSSSPRSKLPGGDAKRHTKSRHV